MVSVGSRPHCDWHNRCRETHSEPSRTAGGHRQYSEKIQRGPLLCTALRHWGCGQGLRWGRDTGEFFLVLFQEIFLSFNFEFFDTYRCSVCVLGECWRLGLRSKSRSVPFCWGSWGWTQTFALETQNSTAVTSLCFLYVILIILWSCFCKNGFFTVMRCQIILYFQLHLILHSFLFLCNCLSL